MKITIDMKIETVEATVGGKVYQMKVADVHEAAARKIFEYGFQRYINDKTGGKTAEEKASIATHTIEAIKTGDVIRTSRTSDPLAKYRRNVIRDLVKATEDYKDAEDRNKYLDMLFDKASDENKEKVTSHAEALKKIDDEARLAANKIDVAIEL